MNFRDYVRNDILKKNDRILEFGPLNRPIAFKDQYKNVYYADIRSTDDIKKLYTSNDYLSATGITIDVNDIVGIDYVITDSYENTFQKEKKFDAIILSHVVEHIPDIINFFDDISKIIKDDGKLVIIYPDARYCFDHFRNGISFIDAYDVYHNKKMNCNSVFDFTFNVVHENNSGFFWNETSILEKLPRNKFTIADDAYVKAFNNDPPDDVHYWPFSDYQFIKFLYDLERAGLLKFDISYFHETEYNNQEFMIILSPKKVNKIDYKKYEEILSRINPIIKNTIASRENKKLMDEIDGLKKLKDDINKENETLGKELKSVYNSKRWRLVSNVMNLKNKLIK